jgi:ligand-binding sensor domain-containing protein
VVHDQRAFVGNSEGFWEVDSQGTVTPIVLTRAPVASAITWLGMHQGKVLAGTPEGLFQRHPTSWKRLGAAVHILGAGAYQGDLLVGTEGDGTWRLQGQELEAFSEQLPEATSFLEDQGELLVGSANAGVFSLNVPRHLSSGTPPTLLYRETQEPPENSITALAWSARQRALYVGTFHHGIGILSPKGWSHQGRRSGLPSDWVNHLAATSSRVFARFSDGQVAQSLFPGHWFPLGSEQGWPKKWTSSLGVDRGRPWVGSLSAFYLSPIPGQWKIFRPKPALDQRMVLDLAHFGGRIWLATHRAGLISLDPETGDWDRISLGTGLSDTWVRSLEVFGGALWAGTFGGGLCRLRFPEDAWEVFRENGPMGALPSNAINALLATDQELFVGTLKGLVQTDGSRWKRFGRIEGLPDANITSLASDGTKLWVGTPSGLAQAPLVALRQ